MQPIRFLRTLTAGAAVLACGLLAAGSASAEFSPTEAPLGDPVELAVELRGRVAARCELTTAPRPAGVRLHQAGEAEGDFRIDCNTPFNMKVRSANGGFAGRAAVLSAALPYEVGVRLGKGAGAHDLGWCDSAALKGAGATGCAFGGASGWSSGDEIAIDQEGRLKLRWREGAPIAGDYRDIITIELEVRS